MKKNFCIYCISIVLFSLGLSSCTTDEPQDSDFNQKEENSGDYSDDSGKIMTEGIVNGHEYIDLGLSVKWAKCNLGAYSSSDFGNYYAWAETITKSSYWQDNYKFYNSKTGTYSAPTSSICGSSYDAASSYWGSKWRMPTQKEAQELIDKCSWQEKTINGVVGYQVVGPNGSSIFLPKAGSFTGYDKGAKSGIFLQMWTGSYARQSDFYFHAYQLSVSNSRKEVSGASVYDGVSIRPVTTASNETSGGSGNNSGSSDDSKEFYETNFTSTEYKDKITVNFYFSDRVKSATIKYGTTSSCSSSKTASVSSKSAYATITGLKSGTKYYFKCVAKSQSGETCTTSVYPAMTNY